MTRGTLPNACLAAPRTTATASAIAHTAASVITHAVSGVITRPGARAVARAAARLMLTVTIGLSALPAAHGESFFFKTSDGARLHFNARGAGEVIVFVPGWLMPGAIWQEQLDYFSARGYRAVALDPRSQGESPPARQGNNAERRAADIAELIAQLRVERVVLVGWSLGVLEALMYVRKHGDTRLAALILVDNSVGEEPPPRSGGRTGDFPRGDRKSAVTRFVRSMFKTERSAAYLDWLTGQALRTPPATAQSLLSLPYPRAFWRAALDETRKPVLYVVTPRLREQADNLAKKRENTAIHVFENAGHALFVDESGRFNALMDDFLKTALGGRNDGHQ